MTLIMKKTLQETELDYLYHQVDKFFKAQEMYDRTKHYIYHHELVARKKELRQLIDEHKQKIIYESQAHLNF